MLDLVVYTESMLHKNSKCKQERLAKKIRTVFKTPGFDVEKIRIKTNFMDMSVRKLTKKHYNNAWIRMESIN